MVAVFSIFATLSLLDFKQMGVGLAVAVLIDATLIRGVLLPATMKLLGERNWWLPRSLGWLPRIETEGGGGRRRELTAPRQQEAPAPATSAGAGRSAGYIRANVLCSAMAEQPAGGSRGGARRRSSGRWSGLDAGAQVCLAIEGEPGIGKTRLLEELRRRAERTRLPGPPGDRLGVRDLRPVRARHRRLRRLPRLAGRRGARPAGPTELRHELGIIFPSLRGTGGAAPSGGDERYRAHRAIRDLVERLAAERPLVVVLDDAHWADDASLELIQSLLRRPADAPALLALGLPRPARLPPRLRGGAWPRPGLERIVLGPLQPRGGGRAARRRGPPAGAGRDLRAGRRQSVLPGAALAHPRRHGGRPRPARRAAFRPASPPRWRRSSRRCPRARSG